MKNLYKISFIVLLTLTIIISSCKKEEEIPVIYGCTDENAMNYLSSANTNDSSCIFAYDIAQGFWNIVTTCEELTISIPFVGDFPVPLNDVFPENIEISGEGSGVVSMDINGENILADVYYDGTVTIKQGQKITIDSDIDLVGVVDVDVTGSGMIQTSSNGDLTLYLSFEVPLAGTQSSSCEIIFTK
jgi:uncharacterized lipoprotein YehR (DUF1307 family)